MSQPNFGTTRALDMAASMLWTGDHKSSVEDFRRSDRKRGQSHRS